MMKRIGALGLAVAFLMCSGFVSWAAVCSSSNSPDGVHHFNVHKDANAGYHVNRGTCTYLYAYDVNNNPIYRSDCIMTDCYEYCNYICKYCNKVDDTQGSHAHYAMTLHSVHHN